MCHRFKAWQNYLCKSLFVLFLVFLQACGGGNKDVQISSVSLQEQHPTIDLSQSTSTELHLKIRYNDQTEKIHVLTLSWLQNENILQLRDENGGIIALDYDPALLSADSLPLFFTAPDTEIRLETQFSLRQAILEFSRISLSPEISTLAIGQTQSLNVTVNGLLGELIQSTNSLVKCIVESGVDSVSVTDNCLLTALKPGEAIISIQQSNINFVVEEIVKASVIVSASYVTGLLLPESEILLQINDSHQLAARLRYSDQTETIVDQESLQCVTNIPEVVSIQAACKITAIGPGTGNITVIFNDPENQNEQLQSIISVSVAEPQLVSISIADAGLNIQAGQQYQLSLEASYTDGSKKSYPVDDGIKCIASTPYFSVSESCLISAITQGEAFVDLQYQDDVISTTGAKITILAPSIARLYMQQSQLSITAGEQLQLQVAALFADGTSNKNYNEFVKCFVVSGQQFVNVSEECVVTALFEGQAEIGAELIASQNPAPTVDNLSVTVADPVQFIKLLEVHAPKSAIFSGENLKLNVSAVMTDDSILNDATDLVECFVEDVWLNFISVTGDCNVLASLTGNYTIFARLKDASLGTGTVTQVPLQLQINALPAGSLNNNTSVIIDIPAGKDNLFYELAGVAAHTVYKVKLEAGNAGILPSAIKLMVLPDASFQGNVCVNTKPAERPTVACGVRSHSDKLYVYLRNIGGNGLQVKINVVSDPDILDFDGAEVIYQSSDYQAITVASVFLGHVPANEEGINRSNYRAGLDTGMRTDLGDYEVSVTFDSPDFNLGSVQIFWDDSTAPGNLLHTCVPQIELAAQRISCHIANELQNNIFVIVFGNGDEFVHGDNNGLSAVEGEASYQVIVNQLP